MTATILSLRDPTPDLATAHSVLYVRETNTSMIQVHTQEQSQQF